MSAAQEAPAHDRSAALRHAVDHAGHYLPSQGPIGVFVHHNTLHAFEHLPFHDAVARASELFGAQPYLPESLYREHLARGRISTRDLDDALAPRRAARRAQPAIAAGAFDLDALDALVLRYAVEADEPTSIRWQLAEHAASRNLRWDVPTLARNRFLERSHTWLDALIRDFERGTLTPDAFEQQLGAGRVREEFEGPWDAATFRHTFTRAPERLAVGALWCHCRAMPLRASPPPTSRHLTERVGEDRTWRDLLLAMTGDDATELVHWALIRAASAWLDQGVALWEMPHREDGFFAAWRALMLRPAVVPAWLDGIRTELESTRTRGMKAADVVLEILDDLGVDEAHWEDFVLRVLLQLPGWAGMMHRLEHTPTDRPPGAPPASLLDFLAVRLTLDRFAWRYLARQHFGASMTLRNLVSYARRHRELVDGTPGDPSLEAAWRLFQLAQLSGVTAGELSAMDGDARQRLLDEVARFDERTRRRVWHEAYEIHHRDEVLAGLAANLKRPESERAVTAPSLQVITCIDDREESFRRHLEERDPSVETFGAAGFFGVAMNFLALEDFQTFPLCPLGVTPGNTVHETAHPDDAPIHETRRRRRRLLARLQRVAHAGTRSVLRGLVLTPALGVLSAFPFAARVLFPRLAARLRGAVTTAALPAPRTVLQAHRESTDIPTGFTLQEQIDRIAGSLTNMGLTRRFARLVLVLGHGAASTNNPHHSAYECGACGGRDGGPSARLFAMMVNRPEVRAGLRAKGIEVPETTWFIGGRHNTSSDEVVLFDEHALPSTHHDDLARAKATLEYTRRASAHERCRRFEHAPPDATPDEALAHVEARTEDLSQARPELGHVTNAVAVFGRRALTRGLFLDRRAFLISYDPACDDAEGRVLERVLAAAGPVGAGINLEYFFSCVDNDRYGCGTKLPHNLTGLLGVMDGAVSDLRTGLPRQMIEIHEPVRLLVIAEGTPERLGAIAARQPALTQLITNGWVRVVSVHPETGALAYLGDGGFVPFEHASDVPVVARSVDWYRGKSDFLPPCITKVSS